VASKKFSLRRKRIMPYQNWIITHQNWIILAAVVFFLKLLFLVVSEIWMIRAVKKRFREHDQLSAKIDSVLSRPWPEILFFSGHIPEWQLGIDTLAVTDVDLTRALEGTSSDRNNGKVTIKRGKKSILIEIQAAGVNLKLRKDNPLYMDE
jgi:hypothetical protein